MIIGQALGRLFDGMTVDVSGAVNVQYTYGDQDHLDKFIALSDKLNEPKYPLVFYVTNPYTEINGWKVVETDLVILMNTDPEFLAKDRTARTFVKYILPVETEVRRRIDHSGYAFLLGNKWNKWEPHDIPNFALTARKRLGVETPKKSAVTDIVDARIIKNIKLRIKTDCI